jgi:hypothetical protein
MRRLLLVGAVLAALFAPASAAASGPYHPTGEFAQFSDCPLSHSPLFACLFSESNGGYFTMGQKTVPIKTPVVLQGGLESINEETGDAVFVGAESGNTLSKTPQPVPGGLTGIVAPSWWPSILRDLFNETINNGFTGVTATVELAGPASGVKVNYINLGLGSGTALGLPAKIKLSNPFLGSNCYLGSNSKPINLTFTTGTTSPPPPNTPITGSPGEFEVPTFGLVRFKGGRLVNNSFPAPGASGCGGLFSFLVDPFVNSIVGVPSPAGTNTAILEGKIEIAVPSVVKESE